MLQSWALLTVKLVDASKHCEEDWKSLSSKRHGFRYLAKGVFAVSSLRKI